MKALDIISALCYMGNTEGAGLSQVGDSVSEYLKDQFGFNETSSFEGEIETDTQYVYSYDDPLMLPCGHNIADIVTIDATVTVGDALIYLYKVE